MHQVIESLRDNNPRALHQIADTGLDARWLIAILQLQKLR